VGNATSDWPRERRDLPAQLVAEAAANPGGAVAEIDGSLVPDRDGYVPSEAVVGIYPVGPDGVATGEYIRNPRYGTVRDDFTPLESPDHWLGWLPDTPSSAVRSSIEGIIVEQVPGSVVQWVKVVHEPAFLTGGRRVPDAPTRVIVTRAGLAAPFALGVHPPAGRPEILTGVFSWIAVGLDTPDNRRDRVWLDLGMTPQQGEELLQQRIYELDPPD
jgi:hypothetical protein